jgi:hypothetical protein
MQKFGLPAAMLLAACAAFAFQAVEPARTSYERRGLYHATVSGRILSHTGEPVSGVHVQLNAGQLRSLPLIDVVTRADGRFTMEDVNAINSPYLTWFPPEQWLKGGISIAGESAEETDVGTIRLQPNTIIRVAVELVGGPPLRARDRESTVVLEGKGVFDPRIVAESVGSERIVQQIPFDDEGRFRYTRHEGRSTMDALAEKLDGRLREWKPETAAEARERITEVIELADHDILDIVRSRAAEQEVLDLLDEPPTR